MTAQPIETLDPEDLRQTLAEVIDVDATEIGEATDFVDELNVDSLLLLELVVVLEKKYGVKFSEREMRTARTFRDAHALLERKLAVSA
ncbi:acyl carrier protein [Streptomyces scopuliridis]|uniref:acyl carrier protein n=1 Tax=Streptomyces scopuliridis TaxID=452529 RepID=UPI0034295CF0